MTATEPTLEVFDNGLTLLLRETRLAPVVNVQIWAKVGSADERPGEEGLAHFHEHMLFKGTERRGVGDVASEVEGAGGRINAYTTFDVTVYYATLPSESLGTGLDVLADAVRNSAFDEAEVAREREVVLEEIRRGDDAPAHVLGDALFETAYRHHPYGKPILGPAENVATFERAKVRAFFERWYTPENLVVVAAGDLDSKAFAADVQAAFQDAVPGTARRSRVQEPACVEPRATVLARPFEGVRVDLAWPGTSFASDDAPLVDLLSFILGECESSRLVRRLRDEEQCVDRIDTSSYAPLERGLFWVSFETDPARAEQACEAVVRDVERLRCEAVSREELERARANFLAQEHFERESVSGQASRLASCHVMAGDHLADARYLERVRTAAPEDLLRVAREILHPERLCAAAVIPDSGAPALDAERILEAAARGVEQTRRRYAKPSRRDGSGRIHGYSLPGGATIHVLPRREVPVVAARAAFLGGLLAEDEATAGISSFLCSMWTRGTRARSSADFARAVESLAAEINGFSGRNSMGFTLEVTADKLDPALDLFAEALLAPGLDADEVERERRETLAAIERRGDQLAQLAYLLFAETLFDTHPYRLPMLGSEDSVKRITAASLRSHHDQLCRAENLVVGVAGDVDPDEIAEALAIRLSDLPSGGFEAPSPELDEPGNGIREASLAKDRAQTHLVLGFPGLTVHDPDRAALDVLAQVLAGQGGRLFLELRDRRGLAYSVSAVNVEGVAPGFFSLYIATAPDKAEEARLGMLAELEALVSAPPSDAELDRARRYLTGSHAIGAQRDASHAAHIALDALYGLGADAHSRYPAEIAAVGPEDVLRVARRILTLDAYTVATVGGVPSS